MMTSVNGERMAGIAFESPKILVLPEDRSPEARICTLAHPRTLKPCQYFFDPERGTYEFIKVAPLKSAYRSWLIAGRLHSLGVTDASNEANVSASVEQDPIVVDSIALQSMQVTDGSVRPMSEGYMIQDAYMLIATPIDYIFLLLPSLLHTLSSKNSSSRGLFLSVDDLLGRLSDQSKHFNHISSLEMMQRAMEERMQAVCDTVDAGDERMYRLNISKLLNELIEKAKNMVAKGLPASMEEKLIRKVLETPIMVVKNEESSASEVAASQSSLYITATPSKVKAMDIEDSQTSTVTNDSTVSAASNHTEITIPDSEDSAADESEIYHLLRMRTALLYMISAYGPPPIAEILNMLLASDESPINFAPLDKRLANLATMRAEALGARSLGDFSRKRSTYEEDEATESRAEKKRRQEEEEKKRKAGESRSIRDLKKVDTKGMKKMSDFFGKGAATKK